MPPEPPSRAVPGRALVTRRALEEIVRAAVLGSYGVTGLAEPFRRRLGLGRRAIRVELRPEVAVDVHLTIAQGLPVAEVARQVDSAIRYGVGPYPGLSAVPLLTDSFAPVCSPHAGVRAAKNLPDATLIHFEWGGAATKVSVPTWRAWAARAGLRGLDAEAGITFNDESSAIQQRSPARAWRC